MILTWVVPNKHSQHRVTIPQLS